MSTTYFGYTQDQVLDAIDFAAYRGWRAKPAHEPAPGDRYVARDDHSELLLAGRVDGGAWLAVRKDTRSGEEEVWRVNPGALDAYYRYARASS